MIVLATIGISLYNENYTIQAASFVFTGWLSVMVFRRNNGTVKLIIGLVFLLFGTMWRMEAALIFIPFVAMDFVFSYLERKKENRENIRYFIQLGICVVLTVTLFASQKVVENLPRYYDGVKYDESRVTMEDYPTYSWDEIEKELPNVDKLEFEAVKMWFLADTDRLDSDKIAKMAEKAAVYKYNWNVSGLCKAIVAMITFVVMSNKILWVLLAFVAICMIRLLIVKSSLMHKIEGVLAVLGGIAIILYFTMLGRAPFRVWVPVIYAVELILISLLSRQNVTKELNTKQKDNISIIVIILTVVGVVYSVMLNGLDAPSTALTAKTPLNEDVYIETYGNDNLYLWGAWHSNVTQYFMSQEKLPTEEFLNHNICTGDWVYGQEYFIRNLEDINAENPVKALLHREDTYFVSEDCDFVLDYIRTYYGEEVQAEKMGEIAGTSIWMFSK